MIVRAAVERGVALEAVEVSAVAPSAEIIFIGGQVAATLAGPLGRGRRQPFDELAQHGGNVTQGAVTSKVASKDAACPEIVGRAC